MFVSGSLKVGARPLTRGDSHVMMLSSGLLDLMPVSSAAVLAHHFETRDMQSLLDASVIGAMEQQAVAEARPAPERWAFN